MGIKTSQKKFDFFTVFTWFAAISSAVALIVYACLGTFSRHMADDYCSVGFIRTNFFLALWNNYQNISDRFSNFILIAISEFIWPRSVLILPGLMVAFWAAGILWLLKEAVLFAGISWPAPVAPALGLTLAFQALLQAPNLYQTLYWRSSMATHFAPLVLLPFFIAFLLRRISSALEVPPSRWLYPVVFLLAFMLGGFSEPSVLIMITLSGCAIFLALIFFKSRGRAAVLNLLAWSFAGAFTTLLVMILAPANSLRLGTPPPALPILISRSFLYAFEFAMNSFRTLPLPSLFAGLAPSIIFYGLYASPVPRLNDHQRKQALALLAVIPVFVYLLIVASFAPSVYGQSFPVERARFAGQFCLVLGLMIEGAGLGILLAQWRPKVLERLPLRLIAAVFLGIAALYPLRAAWRTMADIPEYRARAKLWDLRDDYIRRHAASGERDLIVPEYPGVYGIKELDVNDTHWVNLCVAVYYDVDSLIAVSIPDEYILEYLSE